MNPKMIKDDSEKPTFEVAAPQESAITPVDADIPKEAIIENASDKTQPQGDAENLDLNDSGNSQEPEPENSRNGVLTILSAIVVALVVIWVVSALFPLVKFVLESQGWRMWVSLAVVSIPLLAILIAMGVCIREYFRLPRIVQFSEKDYVGREDRLVRLIKDKYLDRIKVSGNAASELVGEKAAKTLEFLRKQDLNACQWISEFKRFQDEQQEYAHKQIGRFSTRIGAATAVSQMRGADMLSVFVLSALMILQLAKIYNQRMSAVSAFRLSLRWCANVYIAGEAQTVTRKVAQIAGKVIELGANVVGGFVGNPNVGTAAKGAIGGVAAGVGMAAEFSINKCLAAKLGRFAKERLQVLLTSE